MFSETRKWFYSNKATHIRTPLATAGFSTSLFLLDRPDTSQLWARPMHCRMLSSISGLYQQDVGTVLSPTLWQSTVSPDVAKGPLRSNIRPGWEPLIFQTGKSRGECGNTCHTSSSNSLPTRRDYSRSVSEARASCCQCEPGQTSSFGMELTCSGVSLLHPTKNYKGIITSWEQSHHLVARKLNVNLQSARMQFWPVSLFLASASMSALSVGNRLVRTPVSYVQYLLSQRWG